MFWGWKSQIRISQRDHYGTSNYVSSKNLSLMCSPAFPPLSWSPFWGVFLLEKEQGQPFNPLRNKDYPICPYYTLWAHICNDKFRLYPTNIFLKFTEIWIISSKILILLFLYSNIYFSLIWRYMHLEREGFFLIAQIKQVGDRALERIILKKNMWLSL